MRAGIAYALSEAGSGSDAFALQTRAELKGSDYVLNGRKLWITNGKEAGLFVLFATIDPAAGYKGVIFFLDDLQNPASSNADDVALSLRDQFQSFAIDGINCSLCFSAPLNYFSNIATVRFRDRSTSEISRCDACYVKQFALPLPWD